MSKKLKKTAPLLHYGSHQVVAVVAIVIYCLNPVLA
jgi:hypothetical protein